MKEKLWGGIYDLIYRGQAPWEMGGPREEVVALIESGKLSPSNAIDLGCGTGDNVVYLAQQGWKAVGVDISSLAIEQAREKARLKGVQARFLAADVTETRDIGEPFDLVLDYGCLGCILGKPARERYVETLLRLTQSGSTFVLFNFTRNPKAFFNPVPNVLLPGEAERLFEEHFEVEEYNGGEEAGPMGLRVEFRRMKRR